MSKIEWEHLLQMLDQKGGIRGTHPNGNVTVVVREKDGRFTYKDRHPGQTPLRTHYSEWWRVCSRFDRYEKYVNAMTWETINPDQDRDSWDQTQIDHRAMVQKLKNW